jgi:hypothetical protein
VLGHHARSVAQEHYSYQAWLPRWEEAVGITQNANGRPDDVETCP